MQQTILAILALMLVGTFTLAQHRGTIATYNELVDDELEIAASGVALHVMELIGHRAFDARTMPTEINQKGLPAGSAEFTSTSAFGRQGSSCDLDEPFKDVILCTDLDDADMAPGEWQDVPFRLKDGKELGFDVRVEVFYVDLSDLDKALPAGQVSFHKKVVVRVRAKRHVLQKRYANGFVRLERIFSYDNSRAKNRFEDVYGPTVTPASLEPPTTQPTTPPTLDPTLNPDNPVWVCHRSVVNGTITWTTKSIQQKFIQKHVGHGDTAGKC
ncbi:MAG: hypothetical protein BMS9Abin05_2487 [Rhodothermia bacterium]|nr:MAG: hypothetical protein BMS9Abin05_2487 [Rhodothermia bacterium]